VGDPPRWPRDTPLSSKVGNEIRRPIAVAQSVYLTCGPKGTSFLCFPFMVYLMIISTAESLKHRWERTLNCKGLWKGTNIRDLVTGTGAPIALESLRKTTQVHPLAGRDHNQAHPEVRTAMPRVIALVDFLCSCWEQQPQVVITCQSKFRVQNDSNRLWRFLTMVYNTESLSFWPLSTVDTIEKRTMASSGMLSRVALVRTDVSEDIAPPSSW
jgi:hypothetical protein